MISYSAFFPSAGAAAGALEVSVEVESVFTSSVVEVVSVVISVDVESVPVESVPSPSPSFFSPPQLTKAVATKATAKKLNTFFILLKILTLNKNPYSISFSGNAANFSINDAKLYLFNAFILQFYKKIKFLAT
jgi:hypothetical protein